MGYREYKNGLVLRYIRLMIGDFHVSLPDSQLKRFTLTIDAKTMHLIALARKSFLRYDSLKPRPESSSDFLLVRVCNRPPLSTQQAGDIEALLFFGGFALAGLLYGGIHLMAWNGPLHTHVELLLWRISGIVIAAPGLITVVALLPGFAIWYFDPIPLKSLDIEGWLTPFEEALKKFSLPDWIVRYIFYVVFLPPIYAFGVLLYGVIGIYLFSRVYIVVECFLSLPYVPESVFTLPEWSVYFPHIS